MDSAGTRLHAGKNLEAAHIQASKGALDTSPSHQHTPLAPPSPSAHQLLPGTHVDLCWRRRPWSRARRQHAQPTDARQDSPDRGGGASPSAGHCVADFGDLLGDVRLGLIALNDTKAPTRKVKVSASVGGVDCCLAPPGAWRQVSPAGPGAGVQGRNGIWHRQSKPCRAATASPCIAATPQCWPLRPPAWTLLQKYILHPKYYDSRADPDAPAALDNDVALLILDRPVRNVPLQKLAPKGYVPVSCCWCSCCGCCFWLCAAAAEGVS
jgi:hypothetical protein